MSQLPFWALPLDAVFERVDASREGISTEEAHRRLDANGYNRLGDQERFPTLRLLFRQFKSPLIVLLLFAAGLAYVLEDRSNALIIVGIVIVSAALGFWQEYDAANIVEQLLSLVETDAEVYRDGHWQHIPIDEVVPGDVVRLNAGDAVPGDSRLLEADELHVNEAALTGESFPTEKRVTTVTSETPLGDRLNALFMGTYVVSGEALAVVARTGEATELGTISQRLRRRPPRTDFERGLRNFGNLLIRITLVLVLVIFAINVYFARPIFGSFLFALALAVGLTPELLPAIISITLADGARQMARKDVIVKRLHSIENLGSMDTLCVDKTGTLTEGTIRVHSTVDPTGAENEQVLQYAYLNAVYQSGYDNPIDTAIREATTVDVASCEKYDEIPYDFTRKRLSVLVSCDATNRLLTKGAVENVLEVCSTAALEGGDTVDIEDRAAAIDTMYESLSDEGYRVLGVATKDVRTKTVTRDDEQDMTFEGFLVLEDPIKPRISETLQHLRDLGVSLNLVSGDNRHVARHVGEQVGLSSVSMLTGPEIEELTDDALLIQADETDIFAEIEPNQKERIVTALQDAGHVVGHLGDGINDAPALRAADVGISVENAVDVATETAEIVLLEKDLGVLIDGIKAGRRTFANTLKYVFMTTSANFGNMFSLAGASLFLPFLPLLPSQILLINFLSDIPSMTISTDAVDRELIDRPRKWDTDFIKKFMLTFGAVSSIFDVITFGVLLFVLGATMTQFRTGWLLISVLTEVIIVFIIRTRKPFFRSRPSRYLLAATAFITLVTLVFPYTPLGGLFELVPLPVSYILPFAMILAGYVVLTESVKRIFYRYVEY